MKVADFLFKLEEGLREAQNTTREHLCTAQERQKRMHDVVHKSIPTVLEIWCM